MPVLSIITLFKLFIGDTVWIVGSSIVKKAFLAAWEMPEGSSMGLNAVIWWQGYSGLKLIELVQKLNHLSVVGPQPGSIMIHCGGNDLGKTPISKLRIVVSQILEHIGSLFPSAKIIWSEILPRTNWRYCKNTLAMERARRRLNNFAANAVISLGGCYLAHTDFKSSNSELLSSDGVHLSDIGYSIFINNIACGLNNFLCNGMKVHR